MPEQHLSIDWCMKEAQEARGFPHIVLNPRVTMLAQNAHLHLAIRPGADLALRNAMILETAVGQHPGCVPGGVL